MAQRSGLEPSEQQVSLDTWLTPGLSQEYQAQRVQALEVMVAAIEKRHGLYTFWGDFGAGKSLALQIMVNELLNRGVAGCYAPLVWILEHLRSLYQRREGTSRYWQRARAVPGPPMWRIIRPPVPQYTFARNLLR